MWIALCLLASGPAWAMGKKPAPKPAPSAGRRVIALAPVENVRIEMPDQSRHDFGEDFQASLTTKLADRYIVTDAAEGSLKERLMKSVRDGGGYAWPGSSVPSATIHISVRELSFVTGSRGERMFYGFDERMRTPFNDGKFENEFPLRAVSFEPNWFDRSFDAEGIAPFDSRAGLDLGDGFNIDILFAWLTVKYASYHSGLALDLVIDAPLAGRRETKRIDVRGNGFFFDLAGAYEGYSAGIRVARRDAMAQALRKAVDGAAGAIDHALGELPLAARIDSILPDGTLLLGTGPDARVAAGTAYDDLDAPGVTITVDSSVHDGSIAHVSMGDPTSIRPGQILRQAGAVVPAMRGLAKLSATAISQSDSVQLPSENLPKAELSGFAPQESRWQAFLASLEGALTLPYRIWRYFEYDQAYHRLPDEIDPSLDRPSAPGAGRGPIVAVIDSGVDYNHPWIHDSLWLNPAPTKDSHGKPDHYGWDFVSGDAHPFDDGYHGTELASTVLSAAPDARIMPLKVFNPWGITSSAALLSAYHYAVDHGARIILCGWATRVPSRAIEEGVSYAEAHGALVVAAAGDRGDDLEQLAAYPAALSASHSNVVTVAAVDGADRLLTERGLYSNYSASLVTLAAPGQNLEVAKPRAHRGHASGTGLAAALVAGALASAEEALPERASAEWVASLLAQAEPVAALEGKVRGALRLRTDR